mmetsp:Transcript_29416/g.74034  ORF Transcript_29416/g.74034 Transcript_29416/m.74034 type:complete len:243 (-) Transcript_29416:178-906(-)|eukprot:CAMPEP_0177672008 /NCGR_PEP_ID=MMETSP0447-20121125/25067_1 /TAXON_ID=0 /ORGANISM="Stygamoeba regulata, Strain BSH-02190019" /LENGTH=242 /DNA_ID=CAMNT_0019179557 /DNA_START=182 /DNA_END=910 /DNA_ORIENTATION=+
MSEEGGGGSSPDAVDGFENTTSKHGKELGAIPFDKLIGGPLTACIHAQVQSAMATIDFVKKVGFMPPKKDKAKDFSGSDDDKKLLGNPTTVTFEYEKTGSSGMPMPVRLTIPFLTMLPIPTLRIEEVNIDFLAKITSMQSLSVDNTASATQQQTSQAAGFKADESEPYTWTALMSANIQFQRQTKSGASITRDYSLGVKVKCVQDEMPAGLSRLLDILEGAIKESAADSNQAFKLGGGKIVI